MSPQLLESPRTRPSQTLEETPERAESARARERAELIDNYDPRHLKLKNIDWLVLGWMVAMHVGCLFAPFFFTWQALGVAVFLHWLTASIGICLGYHRFLSHRSFKLRWPARVFTLFCGAISGEGSPLMWAATHRVHHMKSDQQGDPHSPLDGPWWSHLLWLFVRHDAPMREALYQQFCPDVQKDPVLRFFERTYPLWLFGTGGVLYALGGWPFVLWGMCVRMVIAYHSTWFVNSATHLWGYRNYETSDHSRNLWWVAVLSYGEGWHNNHHAHPTFARAGHKWWEIDMTWYAIRTLQFLGLAYDVDDRLPADV